MKTTIRVIYIAFIVIADFLGFLHKDTFPTADDD
jgi:hypothetical protein